MSLTLALSTLCENPSCRTGLSTFFREFVAAGLRQRPDVHWIVFAGRDDHWPISDQRVRLVRDYSSNDRLVSRLWADHFLVPRAARNLGADALLTVGFHPLRDAGLPVIMHAFSVHHQSAPGGLRAWYRRCAMERGLRRARLVIANSQWTLEQLGREEGKAIVSHEGLDSTRFNLDGAKSISGLPEEYLLWVGNFYAYKRADRVLTSYARLAPELRDRLPLVLAGGDWQGGRGQAEALSRDLGVADQVRFLGWVTDESLPALYRGARAHVVSSSEETFGRSIVEAMACGCPCVLQDLPVFREVAGQAALFVDYEDADAGAEAMRRIAEDDGLASSLREAGIERARLYSWDVVARERIAAIERALAG